MPPGLEQSSDGKTLYTNQRPWVWLLASDRVKGPVKHFMVTEWTSCASTCWRTIWPLLATFNQQRMWIQKKRKKTSTPQSAGELHWNLFQLTVTACSPDCDCAVHSVLHVQRVPSSVAHSAHYTLHLTTSPSSVPHSAHYTSPQAPTVTFTFSHLADAFVQSDVQGREQSS